jgi:excisionase family DNA binding protein
VKRHVEHDVLARSSGDAAYRPIVVELPPEIVETIIAGVTARVLDAVEMKHASEPTSPYLTVPEAAELMRASRGRIYDLLSQRRLTRHRDGTRVLLSREEIHRYLAGDA